MKNKLILITSLISFFVIFTVSCKKEIIENNYTTEIIFQNDTMNIENPEVSDTSIYENVVVLSENTSRLISTPAELEAGIYKIEFTEKVPDNLKEGSVIIGVENGGYLRKVTSIHIDNKIAVMQTEQASLVDVFKDAKFSFSTGLQDDNLNKSSGTTNYWDKNGITGAKSEGIDVSLKGLYFKNDEMGEVFKVNDGYFRFDPNFTFDFEIKGGELNTFKFGLDKTTFDYAMNYQVLIPATGNKYKIYEKDLLEFFPELEKYTSKSFVVWVNLVPLIFTLELKVPIQFICDTRAGFSFASDYKIGYSIGAGVEKSNGSWGIYNYVNQTSSSCDTKVGLMGRSETKIALFPNAVLKLYTVPGPYVGIEGNIKLRAEVNEILDCNATLNVNLEAVAGAKLVVLEHNLGEFQKKFALMTPIDIWSGPDSLSIISGNSQIASQGKSVKEPIILKVTDSKGSALKDINVHFKMKQGQGGYKQEGKTEEFILKTNDEGLVEVKDWILGKDIEQKLSARVIKGNGLNDACEPVEIIARTEGAYSIEVVSGNNQIGNFNTTLKEPIKILVKDRAGNPVQNDTLDIKVESGSGITGNQKIITNEKGIAETTWTLGYTENEQNLEVIALQSDKTTNLLGSPLQFKAKIPTPTSIVLVQGDNQYAKPGYSLKNNIKVQIKDQDGKPYEAALVTFSVTEGKIKSNIETDEDGFAENSWKLGTATENQALTISAYKKDGITHLAGSPLKLNAYFVDAKYIQIISGNNQTGHTDEELANEIKVLVTDNNKEPFENADVSFYDSEGNLIISDKTDSNGFASTLWKMSSTPGIQTATAKCYDKKAKLLSGAPLTFTATAELAGKIYDSRTATYYEIAILGDDVWFTENLKFSVPVESAPYNNDPSYVATMGYLYTYTGMKNASGVCPTGWHVSTKADWDALQTQYPVLSDMNAALKTQYGGWYAGSIGQYNSIGSYGSYWSPNNGDNYSRTLTTTNSYPGLSNNANNKMSIRCVIDK